MKRWSRVGPLVLIGVVAIFVVAATIVIKREALGVNRVTALLPPAGDLAIDVGIGAPVAHGHPRVIGNANANANGHECRKPRRLRARAPGLLPAAAKRFCSGHPR